MEIDEIWVPIKAYEGLYSVSSWGRVRSHDRTGIHSRGGPRFVKGVLMHPQPSRRGYLFVVLWGPQGRQTLKVHRLVAQHFLPLPEMPEVNHKDFKVDNNHYLNLEWATRQQNMDHAMLGGRCEARTNPAKRRKLTPEDVEQICQMRKSGITCQNISEQFGISHQTVSKIARNLSWRQ
jgi:DNA-binding CsgD family transcriptional regulator